MANWVRYPLPLFWAFPAWRACEVEVRYPPLKKGISAILARYPMKTRQMGAIPPSAILSRKGIARWGGGVSRTGPLSFQQGTWDLTSAGKQQESATLLQHSSFNITMQSFVCCSAASCENDVRTAEKRMLQCNFCSATFRKLQRNFV